jgi:hypothetical protein
VILNLLYQHAHDSGRLAEKNAEWEIPVSSLGYTRHESNDHVRLSLTRLMRIVVQVPRFDAKAGEQRIVLTPLFEFFDLSAGTAAQPPRRHIPGPWPRRPRPRAGGRSPSRRAASWRHRDVAPHRARGGQVGSQPGRQDQQLVDGQPHQRAAVGPYRRLLGGSVPGAAPLPYPASLQPRAATVLATLQLPPRLLIRQIGHSDCA